MNVGGVNRGLMQVAVGAMVGGVGAHVGRQSWKAGAAICGVIEASAELAGRIFPQEFRPLTQSAITFSASVLAGFTCRRWTGAPLQTTQILLFAGGFTVVTSLVRYWTAPSAALEHESEPPELELKEGVVDQMADRSEQQPEPKAAPIAVEAGEASRDAQVIRERALGS